MELVTEATIPEETKVTVEQSTWVLFYIACALVPLALAVNWRSQKRQIAIDNSYLEKLAKEHPEQWRKNERR